MLASPAMADVMIEVAGRRSFAVALDWPGWTRPGRRAEAALDTLTAYQERYRTILALDGHAFDPGPLQLVAQVPGNATTEFGAPAVIADADRQAMDAEELDRRLGILRTCWGAFDHVAAVAPEELRTGPRGGGRMTSEIVAHVFEAERAYASKIGVRPRDVAVGDVAGLRERLVTAASQRPADLRWPLAYWIRRSAWHALDHLWEIEDRSP